MSLTCDYCGGLILDVRNCIRNVELVELEPDLANMVYQFDVAKGSDGLPITHHYHPRHAMTSARVSQQGDIIEPSVLISERQREFRAQEREFHRRCARMGLATWERFNVYVPWDGVE